jgi:hypothetical protein
LREEEVLEERGVGLELGHDPLRTRQDAPGRTQRDGDGPEVDPACATCGSAVQVFLELSLHVALLRIARTP